MLAHPFLQLRGEALDPAVHGRVIHRDAPVGQHPFEVAVADRKLQVPAHGPEDPLGREAKAAECAGGVMTVLSAECWREHRSYPGTTAPLNATDPRGQLSPFAPAHQASFAPRSGPNLATPKPDKSDFGNAKAGEIAETQQRMVALV